MLEVVEINDLRSLSDYREIWNALLATTPDGSFFQSHDWFSTRCRMSQEARPRVLIVYSGGEPVGILPLVVETEQRGLARFRALRYPLRDWGASYGPIGTQTEAVLAAGLAHLRRARRDWDVLDLCWVPEGQRAATSAAMHAAGFSARETSYAQTAHVDLRSGWAAYWGGRKSHWRTNVRGSEKRLAAQGEVRHVRYRPGGTALNDDDPRWDLFDHCVELARRSWQGSCAAGNTMSHAVVEPFLREVHAIAARAGAVDLNLLFVDETPVAFAYNYHFGGYVYGLRTGYDRAARRAGAGSVLLRRTIEDSVLRGDRLYDLGPGFLECKRHWWTRLISTYRHTHFPPLAPRAQAVRLGRWWNARNRRGAMK